MSGAIFLIICVTCAIAQYCDTHKQQLKKIAFTYAVFLALIIAAFIFLFTAALFEAGSSLCFIIVLFLLNRTFVVEEKENMIEQKREYETSDISEVFQI